MTDVDDKDDTSPDGGEERFSDGVPTVPETRDEEVAALMDASTVAMGRTVEEDAPFPPIDGYEIVEAMQAGGQGKLYKARELTPAGREVVLKFPRAGVLSSDRAVALFENEVQKADRSCPPSAKMFLILVRFHTIHSHIRE